MHKGLQLDFARVRSWSNSIRGKGTRRDYNQILNTRDSAMPLLAYVPHIYQLITTFIQFLDFVVPWRLHSFQENEISRLSSDADKEGEFIERLMTQRDINYFIYNNKMS